MKSFYVYILSSKRNGVIYIGVTSNLKRRVQEHKQNLVEGFTKKYKVHNLVYFEETDNAPAAISREKCLKRWKRNWKIELIEKANPCWQDIYFKI